MPEGENAIHAQAQQAPYWIEPARAEDREAINALFLASKSQWGYPAEALEHWRDDLTLSPEDMERHAVYLLRAKAEGPSAAVGTAGLLGAYAYRPCLERTVDLEYLFVAPNCGSQGIGRALLEDFLAGARQAAYQNVRVYSDPNAEAFYRHFGFRRLAGENGLHPAPAPGLSQDRILPVLEKALNPIPGTLHGERVDLCPMDPSDLRHAYAWMVGSNLRSDWIGSPNFADRPLPSWQAFRKTYAPMVDALPETGLAYRIEHEHQAVGVVLHGPLRGRAGDRHGSASLPTASTNPASTKQSSRASSQRLDPIYLEAWMADFRLTRRGYGSDAVRTICKHLWQQQDVHRFAASPSARQHNTIRMLCKLGFKALQDVPSGVPMPYSDTEVLLAEWPLTSF